MKKKKVLIVGSNAIWAIENIYAKYLNRPDMETTIFNCNSYISSTYWSRGLRRLGFEMVYNDVNRSLLNYCQVHKPDVVWVFKGVEIFPETLYKLKSIGITLVNYNPDHPFIRSFRSSGGKNIPESVPLYDFHFCYSRALCDRIKQEYKIPTLWLPFGFELSQAQYTASSQESEIQKICFVGNPDKKRAKIIENLALNGFLIDLYGNGWHKFITGFKNINCYKAIYNDDFWKILRRYRLQINIFREHNEGSHNMRTFEVPAVGGIMLATDSEEHRIFFSDKKEIFLYRNEDDIPRLCSEIMNLGDVGEIRENSRKRSVEEDYSYKNRAMSVYSTLIQFSK